MESWVWIGVVVASILWIVGIPVFAVFAIAGLIFLVAQSQSLILLPLHFFQAMSVYSLIAVSFFILAGNIMVKTHTSDPLFRAAAAWIGHFRGGLAMAAVVASMFFGSISASTLATMSAVGSFAVPSMVKSGYDKKRSMAYLCACGGLGNIIPPSLACIIFAALTGAPVLVLFVAGIVPGVVLTIMFCIQSRYVFKIQGPKATWKERWESTIKAIPPLMIPVVVLGALYTGYATTVEVSILACIMTIVVAAYYRLLNWKIVWQSALDVVGITAFIYFIFGASTFFVDMLAFAQIPQTLVSYLTTGNLSANALLIWLMVSLFIAGMLMDIIPLVFFIVPLTYQAVSAAGIHYLTYNFLIMQIGAIGFCTPPFAVGIFTMAILFKTPAQTIFKAVWIFIPVLILHMLLFIYWRDGLLWLPHLIFGDSIFG